VVSLNSLECVDIITNIGAAAARPMNTQRDIVIDSGVIRQVPGEMHVSTGLPHPPFKGGGVPASPNFFFWGGDPASDQTVCTATKIDTMKKRSERRKH